MLMLRRFALGLAGLLVVVGLGLPAGALGVGDANNSACPNESLEGFREYMADCRAYELVSPSYKGGPEAGVKGISADGSRVLSSSEGAFGGTQGDSGLRGEWYLFSRSGTGWGVSPLGPSQALFPAQELVAASPDLERSLWFMHSASQSITSEDVYLREADGSFVKVGPLVPPTASAGPPGGTLQAMYYFNELFYAGASSDLSHVLFALTPGSKALWPEDTTASFGSYGGDNSSLYEYVGVGNTHPLLVGVEGEGHLISDCEIGLGAPSLDNETYNAVSESGETVFFTAVGDGASRSDNAESECYEELHRVDPLGRAPVVNELYARLGQFPIDTVPISEPTESACEACQTGVASLRHPAVAERAAKFMGASRDGSKVFFLSEQELLPGAKGMNLWEYDFDDPSGQRVLRVSKSAVNPAVEPGVLGVARVSEDGSHVYFVAQSVLTEGKNGEGNTPAEGGDNLYVFERDAAYPAGRLAFVATLSGEDRGDWSGDDEERPVQATPDGRFLVFQSSADLTAGDTSSAPQIFEYDAQSETLVRASVGQTGYAAGMISANANGSSIPTQEYQNRSNVRAVSETHLAVSADGSVVVFESAGALTSGPEVAGTESVYEYRSTGSITDGDVYLVSPLGRSQGVVVDGLDASGGDVFFGTTTGLVTGDLNSGVDVYDARTGGGFPVAGVAGGCVGEACQGSGPASVPVGALGSVSGVGGGNVSPPSLPVAGGGVMAPKPRVLTRAQKLAVALRVCRREPRHRRRGCEEQARRRYTARVHVNGKDRVGA
jgi:hypothetical protein